MLDRNFWRRPAAPARARQPRHHPGGYVDITPYATSTLPAGRIVLNLHWGIGGPAATRGWTLSADHLHTDEGSTRPHIAFADVRLPASAVLVASPLG